MIIQFVNNVHVSIVLSDFKLIPCTTKTKDSFTHLLLVYLFILLFIYCVPTDSAVTPARLIVTRVGPCDVTDADSLISVSEMTIKRDYFYFSMYGRLNISKDIENGWMVKATMQKCHDIRNLDTCDFYKATVVVEDGCGESPQEDLYSMFFHYVTPELSCPLKTGQYRIVEYPFFTEDSNLVAAESKISTSLFGYTFRLEGYHGEDRILCADAYIKHQYIREHEWVVTTATVAGNISVTTPSTANISETDSNQLDDGQ